MLTQDPPQAAVSEALPQPAQPLHVTAGMNVLRTVVAAGEWALAVEAISAVALLDIQRHQQQFLKDAGAAATLGRLYGQVFSAAGLRQGAATPGRIGNRRIRVLISTFALTDGQSAATSIARWVELLDSARYDVAVMSCEELTERRPALHMVKRPVDGSRVHGADVLAALEKTASAVRLVPVEGTLLDGAMSAIATTKAHEPDVLLSVASPACPIQAALIHAGVAPVQLVMNIGVPLVMPGSAIVYHNDAKAADDAATLENLGIRQHQVATIGTDLRLCASAGRMDRRAINVPDDAVLLLSVGNQLVKRFVFAGYAQRLARFLAEHPRCYWAGVGKGDFAPVLEIMRRAGVEDRVRIVGAVTDPRPVMKAADVLLNEYPEGGGNTVLEAMGCGLPVLAMHAGTGHAERIGAMLVGDDAIASMNEGAYWDLLSAWTKDPGVRAAAGARQRSRAEAHFDYSAIVRGYERIIAEELRIRGSL